MGGITLQISLAPPDATYACLVLPHQLRIWAEQSDEVLLTLDLRRPRGRQFGANWGSCLDEIRGLLTSTCRSCEHARVVDVDYSKDARRSVSDTFFGGERVPEKDFRGGPYYSYFYGLYMATYPNILHLDADMMFGGGSKHWLTDAIALLEKTPEALFINPFPGPPLADGTVGVAGQLAHCQLSASAYAFRHVSTRAFLLNRKRFADRLGPLRPERTPGWRMRLGAIRARRTTHALPEETLSRAMRKAAMCRIDLLGSEPGMWTIHPVTHDEGYLAALPELIRRIERNELTPAQVGEYNLHPSMLAGS